MNIDRFTKSLEKAFSRTAATELGGERVWRLRKPRPLAPLLEKSLEGELYRGTFQGWPGNVREILDEHGLHRALATLSWDGFGPVSWSAGVVAIETGGRAYLCSWDELESYQVHAAVSSVGDSDALRELVVGLLASGSLVQNVPHYVWNYAPGLLDREAIEDAFARQLDASDGWGALAEEHYGRIVEPNHLQRCLDILERLPRLDELDKWVDAREGDDGSDLPESARRTLLREFVDRGYEEVAPDPPDSEGYNTRLATEEDLERIFGSGNLLIGFPVRPPTDPSASEEETE